MELVIDHHRNYLKWGHKVVPSEMHLIEPFYRRRVAAIANEMNIIHNKSKNNNESHWRLEFIK